ncbi:CapA family protein [Bacillus songklensis]|uniref:CapA family protein n=1 Tax=Bacillus songklensis TaxID=1069116 RepID=A0ABV8B8B5_9BACI
MNVKRGVLYTSLALLLGACSHNAETTSAKPENQKEEMEAEETVKVKKQPDQKVKEATKLDNSKPVETSIKISAAGDFTLGTDESFSYAGTFNAEAEKNGLGFFTRNIKNIFENDDLTTVNLETTLTNATQKAAKTFRFKGDPSYVNILKNGSVEAVNLANNHTMDYLQQGYDDTIANLKKAHIGYFGYKDQYITTVKGVKVGALGYKGWDDTAESRQQIKDGIQSLRNQGAQIVLVHFHWGDEKQYVPNGTQTALGRFAVDNGADLVLGHHPHVVQGIEEYKGKFIVYSLGNFMFGGNKNPSDKDTFVYQQTFHIKNGKLTDQKEIKIIPFRISSVAARNNYQPTPLEGEEAERVKNKILNLSDKISGSDWVAYEAKNNH